MAATAKCESGVVVANSVFFNKFDEIFQRLTNCNDGIRNAATTNLILYLKNFAKHKRPGLSQAVQYVLYKLIDGLVCSYDASQTGCCVALEVILRSFPDLSLNDVIENAKPLLKSKNLLKQHKLHSAVGNSLFHFALVHSGRITEDLEVLKFTVTELRELYLSNRHLCEMCGAVLIELLGMVDSATFKSVVWPVVAPIFEVTWDKYSCDTIRMLMLCSCTHPEVVDESSLKRFCGFASFLNVDAYPLLIKKFLECDHSSDRVHLVWVELIHKLLPNGNFIEFWNLFMEATLQRKDERMKVHVFLLAKSLLPHLDRIKYFLGIFQLKFLKNLAASLSIDSSDRNGLRDAGLKLVSSLRSFISESGDVKLQVAVIKRLIECSNTGFLDKRSLAGIMSSLPKRVLKEELGVDLITHCKQLFSKTDQYKLGDADCEETDTCRIEAVNLLSEICIKGKTNAELQLDVLKFFVLNAFFERKANSDHDKFWCDPASVSLDLHKHVAGALYEAVCVPSGHIPFRRAIRSRDVLVYMIGMLEDPSMSPYYEIHPKIKERLHSVLEFNKQSKPSKWAKKKVYNEIIGFIHAIGIFVFEDQEKILRLLKDYEQLLKDELNSDQKDEDGKKVSVIFMDKLIDFIGRIVVDSHPALAAVARKLFSDLVPHMTMETVDRLISRFLSETADEVDFKACSDECSEGSNSDEDEKETEDSCEEVVEEKTKALRKSVRIALGDAAENSDEEEEEEEIVFNDDDMMKLDKSLAKAFKALVRKSKPNEEGAVPPSKNFMLILTLVKSPLSVAVAMRLFLPLVSSILKHSQSTEDASDVILMIVSLLQHLANLKSFDREVLQCPDAVYFGDALRLIGELRFQGDVIGDELFQRLFFFLLRCASHMDKLCEKRHKLTTSYVDDCFACLKQWLNKNIHHGKGDSLIPYLLQQFLSGGNSGFSSRLVVDLYEIVFASNVRPFKKNQALEMLLQCTSNIAYMKYAFIRLPSFSEECLSKIVLHFKSEYDENSDYFVNLIRLTKNIVRLNSSLRKQVSYESLKNAICGLSITNNKAASIFGRLCVQLKMKSPFKKRKNLSVGDHQQIPKKKKMQ